MAKHRYTDRRWRSKPRQTPPRPAGNSTKLSPIPNGHLSPDICRAPHTLWKQQAPPYPLKTRFGLTPLSSLVQATCSLTCTDIRYVTLYAAFNDQSTPSYLMFSGSNPLRTIIDCSRQLPLSPPPHLQLFIYYYEQYFYRKLIRGR